MWSLEYKTKQSNFSRVLSSIISVNSNFSHVKNWTTRFHCIKKLVHFGRLVMKPEYQYIFYNIVHCKNWTFQSLAYLEGSKELITKQPCNFDHGIPADVETHSNEKHVVDPEEWNKYKCTLCPFPMITKIRYIYMNKLPGYIYFMWISHLQNLQRLFFLLYFYVFLYTHKIEHTEKVKIFTIVKSQGHSKHFTLIQNVYTANMEKVKENFALGLLDKHVLLA